MTRAPSLWINDDAPIAPEPLSSRLSGFQSGPGSSGDHPPFLVSDQGHNANREPVSMGHVSCYEVNSGFL